AVGDSVLEIGAGTGYNAALLVSLVTSTGRVVTVDLDEGVAAEARDHLDHADAPSVRVVTGEGWLGGASGAPYDRIEVTVGVWDISPHWVRQLRPGGVLVAPVSLRPGVQASIAFARVG